MCTVKIKGEVLPKPSKESQKGGCLVIWGNEKFHFRSDSEYSEWGKFFGKLLRKARDKD